MIDHAIGPVWEANHVWLIFIFVVLWTCFPEAYASITLTVFVPLTIAALGIVLRGSGFAFRKAVFAHARPAELRRGVRLVLGARPVLHGRGRGGDRLGPGPRRRRRRRPVEQLDQPDLDPRRRDGGRDGGLPRIGVPGVGRPPAGDDDMVEYFRRRAVVAAVVAGVVAFAGIFVLHHDAPYLYEGLTSRALPVVILSALCGAGSLYLLLRRSHRRARVLAAGAVATIVLGWGIGQWDYVLPTSLTVAQAAAPSGTITAVLVATALAVVLLGPSFVLLYTLDQRSLLPAEGVGDQVSGGS